MGIMEKNMETTIVYWSYIGIMQKNMETTICPTFTSKASTRRSSTLAASMRTATSPLD